MGKYTILLADDNESWCDSVTRYIGLNPAFELVGVAHNGEDAIQSIQETRPDVILLDLVMPVFDGLYVIDLVRNHMYEYKPFIYVISELDVGRTQKLLSSLEVDYYSVKPVHPKVVAHNLFKLLNLDLRVVSEGPAIVPVTDTKAEIEDYLYQIGAPLNLISTRCVRSIIKTCLERDDLNRSMSSVYRYVGGQENLKPGAVERNVRSVIGHLQKNDKPYFKQCFPETGKKLTNTEFIAKSVYFIRKRIDDASRGVRTGAGEGQNLT